MQIHIANFGLIDESDNKRADRLEKELKFVLSAIVPMLDPAGSQACDSALNAVNRLVEIRRRLEGQESLHIGRMATEMRLIKYRLDDSEADLERANQLLDSAINALREPVANLNCIRLHPWRFAFKRWWDAINLRDSS